MNRDIVIIGGGPGGYVAAIRGAQLGYNVTLIEKHKIGGTCLNYGCIPTKALYRNAEILNTLKNIDEYGISVDNYSFDIEKIQSRKAEVVNQLVTGIEQLLNSNNIEVIEGTASFLDKNTLKVIKTDGNEEQISAKNIVIATGSKAFLPNIEGIDLDGVYTSKELLDFEEVPKRLVVAGGGVIGMEMAGIFNSLGSEVSVIHSRKYLLKQIDKDVSKRFASYIKKQGTKVITSSRISKIEKAELGLKVYFTDKKGEKHLDADAVLISTGRRPVVDGLNLESIGIEYDDRGIKVDNNFMTNVEGIYAIGDVNGQMMLAHVASHQGITAVDNIAGLPNEVNYDVVPNCIFVFPEIAASGITEDMAKENEIECKASKFLFRANGKALALGEPEGFVKVISDMDDKIIGVQIMGPHASDLIHEGTLAINKELSVTDISHTIHAHPTLSEAFMEATMGLNDTAIHLAPLKGRRK
ncbi:dihydrolipoyl dehydrogenase [Sporosalibacterium faouarense]|uniref:dihydrolipoyl dehydrogenase n=1 Tax=Sporosalibacterium faouarense TaxID=516123 RepID=UPI00192C6B58|nr:dihydrolipoyl dehydrogenase [Sporosalibacterium faouarense]